MNKAQGAAAAGESAEPTSTQPEPAEPQQQQQPAGGDQPAAQQQPAAQPEQFGTRLGEILGDLDLPEDVLKDERKDAKPKPQPKAAEGQQPAPAAAAPDPNAAPAAPAAAAPGAAAEDDDKKPLPDEWPESARAQVMEERTKRKKRTEELNQERSKREAAEQREKQLQEQLRNTQAVRIAPTSQNPLADVTNEEELGNAKQEFEQLLEFAELNRDGAEGVVIGKNEDGSPKTRDYTAEDMAKLRIHAQKVLRDHIPERAAHIADKRQNDGLARQLYPGLFDENSQDYKLTQQMAQRLPEIKRFSDDMLNLGRWLIGVKWELAQVQRARAAAAGNGNGAAPKDPKLAAFTRPQAPIAPTAPAARAMGAPARAGQGDVDVEKAQERVLESGGGDQELEDLVSTLREDANAGGRKAAAPV